MDNHQINSTRPNEGAGLFFTLSHSHPLVDALVVLASLMGLGAVVALSQYRLNQPGVQALVAWEEVASPEPGVVRVAQRLEVVVSDPMASSVGRGGLVSHPVESTPLTASVAFPHRPHSPVNPVTCSTRQSRIQGNPSCPS